MKSTVWAVVMSLMLPISAGAAIKDIQVSNQTSAAATISWITDSDTTGEVHYSENADLSTPLTAYDERGESFVGHTHYVTIVNLKKENTYYFEVISGGEVDNNSESYYTLKTMKESMTLPCTIYGFVNHHDGTSAENAIIYLWVIHDGVDSYLLSKLIPSNGSFTPDIKGTRSVATDDLFPSIDSGDPINFRAVYSVDCTISGEVEFESCIQNLGDLTLQCSQSNTTTPTTIPTPTTIFTATTTLPGSVTTSTSIIYSTSTTSTVRPIPDTTTSSPSSSSTTTTAASSLLWPLAYEKLWADKSEKNLSLLRSFRDEILVNNDLGRDYLFSLYSNSLEIAVLLIFDPLLTTQTKEIIDEMLPGIPSLLKGGNMTLSTKQLAGIESLLTRFETNASIRLKSAIKKVQKDIREERIFQKLNIQKVK